ncbi:hypothetical protein DYB32_006108 [Aphanomyces invadans]|uniref:Helicase ATP-binding domain-containing protein n=1 Tax=Aphanomyces invadans TaxID=157072 RepID=A0A418AS78_9STRA|nr:hypothetical protein DYB32_006108 [Aphanomyces invadans]
MLAPVSDYMESRKFKGKGRKKYLEDQELRREKEARNIKRKMNDHKYINSATLRRARVEKLNELLEQGKGEEENMLPLIADGAVDEANTQTMLLENGKPAEVPKVELNKQRSCYTCKVRYEALHHFYDQLCPSNPNTLLAYQTTLKLLLAGATVIATSRFPHDTAERYAAHPDYATFKDRLHVFGIDFRYDKCSSNIAHVWVRDLVHLEHFMDFVLQTYPRLDVVIHNACQTIRRPTSYYAHMMPKESTPFLNLPANIQATLQQQQAFTEALHRDTNALLSDGSTKLATGNSNHHAIPSALKSQVPMLLEDHDMTGSSLFPQGLPMTLMNAWLAAQGLLTGVGHTDVNGQQLDLRTTNSWVLKMGQVSTPEVAEVFAINTLAPFIMNSRLRPLLEKTEAKAKYIINVSAMEGKFYRYKTPNHPHTNSTCIEDQASKYSSSVRCAVVAKAALNMMTRTCAEELSKYGIYMNSVDTGLSDPCLDSARGERPCPQKKKKRPGSNSKMNHTSFFPDFDSKELEVDDDGGGTDRVASSLCQRLADMSPITNPVAETIAQKLDFDAVRTLSFDGPAEQSTNCADDGNGIIVAEDNSSGVFVTAHNAQSTLKQAVPDVGIDDIFMDEQIEQFEELEVQPVDDLSHGVEWTMLLDHFDIMDNSDKESSPGNDVPTQRRQFDDDVDLPTTGSPPRPKPIRRRLRVPDSDSNHSDSSEASFGAGDACNTPIEADTLPKRLQRFHPLSACSDISSFDDLHTLSVPDTPRCSTVESTAALDLARMSAVTPLTLLGHQQHAVEWMQMRERPSAKPFRGGILADEMGLGKSVCCLALIAKKAGMVNYGRKKKRPTLIITPLSLVHQWEQEIKEKTTLSVGVYHGANRKRFLTSHDLYAFDIILTTYDTLRLKEATYTRPTMTVESASKVCLYPD